MIDQMRKAAAGTASLQYIEHIYMILMMISNTKPNPFNSNHLKRVRLGEQNRGGKKKKKYKVFPKTICGSLVCGAMPLVRWPLVGQILSVRTNSAKGKGKKKKISVWFGVVPIRCGMLRPCLLA
jgi:hypothetical protein